MVLDTWNPPLIGKRKLMYDRLKNDATILLKLLDARRDDTWEAMIAEQLSRLSEHRKDWE